MMTLHSPIWHTDPARQFPLVKKGESRYNGSGAEILLCGRSHLLHRGVGRFQLSTSRPLFALPLLYCMIWQIASNSSAVRLFPGRFQFFRPLPVLPSCLPSQPWDVRPIVSAGQAVGIPGEGVMIPTSSRTEKGRGIGTSEGSVVPSSNWPKVLLPQPQTEPSAFKTTVSTQLPAT